MDHNYRKTGLINIVILLALGGAGLAAARFGETLAGLGAVLFAGLGFLVASVSWFQMRLEEQERLEKLEQDELSRSAGSATLFKKSEDAEAFPAQRSREQFERFLVPAFTILLGALQGFSAWLVWKALSEAGSTHLVRNPLIPLGVFAFMFLVAFLFGKYSATTARLEKVRLLRPGAGYLLLSGYLFLAVAVGIAIVEAGVAAADYYVAWGFVVLLAVLAAETLVHLVFEIYRPRVKGRVGRPLYESRLVGLIGTPEGLVTTAAQALDYQFGFRVSETWFYRFLERWLGRIILLQIAILLISTCVVFIEPGEQGLIERFGRAVTSRPVLEAGPHFKWPWPVDRVHRYRSAEVKTVNVGFEPDPARENDPASVWTIPHYKEEFNMLVASREAGPVSTNVPPDERTAPVNLLTVNVPLQFEITDVRAWAYNHDDSATLLEHVASREIVRYLVSVDLEEILSTGRGTATETLHDRVQAEANRLQLGVNIIFVGLQDIHPPTKVADAFENVVGARQTVEAMILKAQGEASSTTLLASAEAITRVREAEASALSRISDAAATAAQFTNQIAAYVAAPEVYRMRRYVETISEYGGRPRKYLIAPTNTQDVIQLNLEDRVRNLGDLSVGE